VEKERPVSECARRIARRARGQNLSSLQRERSAFCDTAKRSSDRYFFLETDVVVTSNVADRAPEGMINFDGALAFAD